MIHETPVFMMSPPRKDWTIRGRSNRNSQLADAPDPMLARDEWRRLADAIVAAGGDVVVLPPNPKLNLTGLPYTAEAGEFFKRGEQRHFLLPRMGVMHRRDEAHWIGLFVGKNLECLTHRPSVPWEAQGDCIRVLGGAGIIHTFGSGNLKRTSPWAYRQVAWALGQRHMHLHFHADPWFHGNTFLNVYRNAYPARLGEPTERLREIMLVCPQALLPGELDRLRRFAPTAEIVPISVAQSRAYDTNALQVKNTVLASDTLSDGAQDALRSLELDVQKLSFSELFSKGGGAPVCLTNRLWGISPDEIPPAFRWSRQPAIEDHTDL